MFLILQQFMETQEIYFQFAPPYPHCRNASERTIFTFNNHFISGLCSTDEKLPLNLWDKFLPQCLIRLNLLRGSRINTKLLAYAQFHGAFYFNGTPLNPTGNRVLLHLNTAFRGTWDPHAVGGWCVGPSLNHYRNFNVWITNAPSQQYSDKISWFLSHIRITHASTEKSSTTAAQDMVTALSKPAPLSPFDPLNSIRLQDLLKLADIFKQSTDPGPQAPTKPVPVNNLTLVSYPSLSPPSLKTPKYSGLPPITIDAHPRMPQYAPQRVSVSLVLALGLRLALLMVPGLHLVSTTY